MITNTNKKFDKCIYKKTWIHITTALLNNYRSCSENHSVELFHDGGRII